MDSQERQLMLPIGGPYFISVKPSLILSDKKENSKTCKENGLVKVCCKGCGNSVFSLKLCC